MSFIFSMFSTSPSLKAESLVYDLKARLDWGAPALTIIDVRDRDQFNFSHIMGAIPIPMGELVERAFRTLEWTRDIYVYGDTDRESSEAASKLRQAGYQNVSAIKGGVAAWKAVGYPVESVLIPAVY